jgi:hypothetical protein
LKILQSFFKKIAQSVEFTIGEKESKMFPFFFIEKATQFVEKKSLTAFV